MTKRLYYTDSYITKFDAHLIDKAVIDGVPALILDATYFYPTGGGQPHDTGILGDCRVLDVVTQPEDQAVLHLVEKLPTSNTLVGEIDWSRRFDHMRHHT